MTSTDIKDGNQYKWYLEQDRFVDSGRKMTFSKDDTRSIPYPPGTARNGNTVAYDIPGWGGFRWAYRVKSIPQKYADYLYISNYGLSFKVSEESESFADAMTRTPPFYIDEVTKNKLRDLNDVQSMSEYSTFVHQSEDPDKVRLCSSFNPLVSYVVLKRGVERVDCQGDTAKTNLVCTDGDNPRLIEMDNHTSLTRLDLQFEDGELDDPLKIYTNYVRVDDGFGDFHYDLYFNIQNLFNSPFEYISTVTGQPNVLILPDSYLYLSGDKFTNKGDHNEIDENKVKAIQDGGNLVIYGQLKTYSDDVLSDVRTIKLFEYKIYNVSDDKPKFLINRIYDITKTTLGCDIQDTFKIEFSDVLWTAD